MKKIPIAPLFVQYPPEEHALLQTALQANPQAQFTCQFAPNLPEAAATLASQNIDILLLHISGTGEADLANLHALRQHAPNLPLLVTGAGDDAEITSQVYAAGAQEYLPASPQCYGYLPHAIRHLLREKHKKNRQKHLEVAFDSSPSPQIVVTLRTGEILDVNQAFCQQSGYAQSEMVGISIASLEMWQSPAQRRDVIALLRAEQPRSLECVLKNRSGNARVILVSSQRIWLEEQECAIFSGLDITERKNAETAQREGEKNLNLFFAQSLDGFFFMLLDEPVFWNDQVDKEKALDYVFAHQRVTRVNDAMLAQYDADIQEFLGKTPADFFAHDMEQGRAVWRQFFDAGHLYINTDERKMDGTPLSIEGDYVCMYDAQGRITGHFGIQRDVTSRKMVYSQLASQRQQLQETVNRLRASEEMLQTVIESIPVRVFWKDKDLRYLGCNQLFAQDAGAASPQEMLGKDDFAMGWKEQAALYRADDSEVLRSGREKRQIVEPQATPQGTTIWLSTSKVPLKDYNGERIGVLGIYEDVTERRQAEKLVEAQRGLARLGSQDLPEQEIWQSCIEIVIRAAEMDSGGIYLLEQRDNSLHLVHSQGLGEKFLGQVSHYPAHSANVQLLLAGKSAYFDVEAIKGLSASRLEGLTSIFVLPIKHKNQVLGGINIASHSVRQISLPTQKAMEALAAEVGSIIVQRRTEAALRERERLYHSLVDAMDIALCRWLPDTTLLYANPRYREIFGIQETATSQKWLDLLPEENRERTREIYQQLTLHPQRFAYEHPETLPDGQIRQYHWIDTPIYDHTGALAEFQSVGWDVTEQKRMQESLARSEALLREAQRIGRIAHMEWNNENQSLLCSEELYDILEAPHTEKITRQTIGALIAPEERQRLKKLEDEAFANREDISYEYKIRPASGKERWLYQHWRITYAPNGMPTRMMAILQDITERKQTEETLRAQEELYRLVSTIHADYVFYSSVSAEGKSHTEWVGGGFTAITGYTFEEFTAQGGWKLLLHPDDEEKDQQMHGQLTQNQKTFGELRILHKNGTVRWVNIHVSPQWSAEEERLVGLYGTVQDITERHQAEAALHASEDKYRALVESMDSLILTAEADGRITYANAIAARALEKTPQELTGSLLKDILPPEVAVMQAEIIRRVIKTDQEAVYEAQGISSAPRWQRISVQPVHEQGGRVGYVLINATDIHQLKTAQEELEKLNRTLEERVRERAAEVQDLYDNSPIGYHSLDRDGYILRINKTHLRWLGCEEKDALGRHITDFLSRASKTAFPLVYDDFKRNGFVRDLDFEMMDIDGRIIPVLINSSAVYNPDGNYVMSRTSVFDNTLHKKADQALLHANHELERALRMKDEFLANMSHELRTPLNGILGLSEILLDEYRGALNEQQRKFVSNIENSGRHLLSLINDLLDLSKIEAGKLQIRPEMVIIGDVCHASMAFVKEMAAKKGISLQFQPETAVLSLMADERRLKQILVNLLSNAVKFTQRGGQVTLRVKANINAGYIEFIVQDSGIGITPEDLNRLFTPFTQVDSSLSRQHDGTGLGLALVKRLVEMHGGSVSAQSEFGKGSEFTVTLPWRPAPEVQTAMEEPPAPAWQAPPPPLMPVTAAKASILLAEDNEISVLTISDYLQNNGYRVYIAPNGRKALEEAAENQPDLILMDIQMPEMDGIEAIQRLRADPRFSRTPIIALTALAMPGDRERCLQAGASNYISKPVILRELLKMVEKSLSEPEN